VTAPPAPVLTTARLALREIVADDAPFVRALLNDPGFIEQIGDRGIGSDDDARRYIADRYTDHYARHGYGIYLVEADGVAIGTCGLVCRDGFAAPDLGYAFLAAHCGQGFGREAAEAVLRYGGDFLGLKTIIAFTKPGNLASAALLRRLGFVEEGLRELPGYPGMSLLFRHAFPDPVDRLGDAQPSPTAGATSS
jgi:ribosomal-protein-alanine N-acetyltransferase